MPKKLLILLAWPLFHSCGPPNSIYPAFSIVGTYKLTQYNTTTKDLIPSGVMVLSPVDDQHVNLVVEGTCGKTKLAYSYRNVVVSSNGRDYLGKESYRLTYKKASIGLFSSDDRGHYITLSPKPMITLVAEIPTDDL